MEGRFNGGFFALRVWGLIFGGAYTWRGLFSEFYGISVPVFTFSCQEIEKIELLNGAEYRRVIYLLRRGREGRRVR